MKRILCVVLALAAGFLLLGGCNWFKSDDGPAAPGVNEGEKIEVDDSLSLYVTKSEDIVTDEETGFKFAAGELVLTAKPGVTRGEVESALAAEKGEIVGVIEILDQYQARFEGSSTLESLNALSDRLMETGLFDYCDINLAVEMPGEYYPLSDSKWKNQWSDSPSGANWGVEAIRAPQMWDYRDKIGWVNVGVYDNYFYDEHEDLVYTSIFFDTELDFSAQSPTHGTHVSGTIAAGFDNGTGITGVAPYVHLYGVSSAGVASSEAVSTSYAFTVGLVSLIAEADCRVVNVSMGYDLYEFAASRGNLFARAFVDDYNLQLERSLLTLIAKGYEFVIVKAAGNQNSLESSSNYKYNPDSSWFGYVRAENGSEYGNVSAAFSVLSGISNPIVKDRIIVVGAAERLSNGDLQVADFSNRGSRVDIIAPGVNIESTVAKRGLFGSIGSGYEGGWNGTSMAAPHVSGVAAAIFGANPQLSGAEVKEIIVSSASAQTYGYKNPVFTERYRLLDAEAAIKMALGIEHKASGGFSVPAEMSLTIGETNIIELEGVASGSIERMEWVSANSDYVTVTDMGIIYGKAIGEAAVTVTAKISGQDFTGTTLVKVTPIARESILVLDISGSMEGTPLDEMKKSAAAFCEAVLADSGSNNRVGLVVYDSDVDTYELSSDIGSLLATIDSLRCGSRTNLQGALQRAKEMMDASARPGAIKNIIVMTDGLPNEGFYSSYGQFSQKYAATDYYTEYADSAFETAEEIMQKYNLYSLGYFHSLSSGELSYAQDIMQNSQNKGYYQVNAAEELEFVFAEITEHVSSGARLVINIACPVDVEIVYNGERLSSAGDSFNDYTSFGTLQLLGRDRDIKILNLSPGIDYDIEMRGTGEGEMEYTINYFDEGETIVDSRSFPKVPLTPTTHISTNTESEGATELNIDADGDGKVDMIWSAAANSVATQIWTSNRGDWWLVVLIAGLVLCGAGAAAFVVYSRRDKGDRPVPAAGPVFAGAGGGIKIISGELAGGSIPIGDGETINFGRDTAWAHMILSGREISRRHCSITYSASDNCYYVCNSSQHGTFIEGGLLPRDVRTRVERGQRLTLVSAADCVLLLE